MSFLEETRTLVLNGKEKRYKFSIELNHQNDYIDEDIKKINNKPLFYAKLWYDAMQLARLQKLPLWYLRKRDSADSGISAVE
jgi:predicted nicotinamide N-methyase